MAFRSLVLVSLLLLGGMANSSAPTMAAEGHESIDAVNAVLTRQKLVLTKGVPVLKAR